MATPPRLAIRGLDKTFGLATVLSGVDFEVAPGEVHGLAGANGSGKSTLTKIVTGVYSPDEGAAMEIDGAPVRLPVRWPEVHAAGVAVVHQDLGLLDELSVADNICIGGFPHHRLSRRIDRAAQRELASTALRRIGADIDPARPTPTLTAPERAEVAVARALRDHHVGGGLVIMDESTRALAGTALDRVHGILRRLAAEGTSIVLISHSLPELLSVTDRVTVLRNGRVSGGGLPTAGLTEAEVARHMLGSDALDVDLGVPARRRSDQSRPEPVLKVSGLSGGPVAGVSFEVGRGEVVGITGLPGSGYESVPYLLSGASPASGRLEIGSVSLDLERAGVARCLRAGIVLVPEHRIHQGLAVEMSVRDNITLPRLRLRSRRWRLGRAWQEADADRAVHEFGIRPTRTDRLVKTLSGGNQQKVLLAKWLGASPTVLVLHEPTQAVDVGARLDILRAVRRAAESGVSVVLVSGEPADLVALCDRVLVTGPDGGLTDADVSTPDELLELVYHPRPQQKV